MLFVIGLLVKTWHNPTDEYSRSGLWCVAYPLVSRGTL